MKVDIIKLLSGVKKENFNLFYDKLIDLITPNKEGISKDDIQNILVEIMNEVEIDMYQEEVIIEVSSRLDRNIIDW